jgi:hypothetical protein
MEYPRQFTNHIGIEAVFFGVFMENCRIQELSLEESHKTLAMANESAHNNPQDLAEERFVRLEEQVTNISHNMALLMAALASKLESFGEAGGSKSKIRTEGKPGGNDDPEK